MKDFKFVHFVKENEFEEVVKFREQVQQLYNIEIQIFGPDFKKEVARLIEEQGIKTIIMGNRSTDPWS